MIFVANFKINDNCNFHNLINIRKDMSSNFEKSIFILYMIHKYQWLKNNSYSLIESLISDFRIYITIIPYRIFRLIP